MFKEVDKGVFSANHAIPGVRIGWQSGSVRVTVDRDLFAKLGEPKFVKVMTGEGDHAGMVAIVPIKTKLANAYTMNQTNRSISLSPKKLGVKYKGGSLRVPHELTEDGLVIDLRSVK